jgi:hypothetical protein
MYCIPFLSGFSCPAEFISEVGGRLPLFFFFLSLRTLFDIPSISTLLVFLFYFCSTGGIYADASAPATVATAAVPAPEPGPAAAAAAAAGPLGPQNTYFVI